MFTIKDVAKRYGVSETTVLGWILQKDLKAINVGRSLAKKKPRWRITQAAIDAFEAARSTAPKVERMPRRRKYMADMDVIEFIK